VPGRAGTHSSTLRRPRKELGWDQAAICSTCVHISSRIATILSFCLAQRNKKRQDKLGVLGYTPIPSCAAVLNASRLRRDVWFFIIKKRRRRWSFCSSVAWTQCHAFPRGNLGSSPFSVSCAAQERNLAHLPGSAPPLSLNILRLDSDVIRRCVIGCGCPVAEARTRSARRSRRDSLHRVVWMPLKASSAGAHLNFGGTDLIIWWTDADVLAERMSRRSLECATSPAGRPLALPDQLAIGTQHEAFRAPPATDGGWLRRGEGRRRAGSRKRTRGRKLPIAGENVSTNNHKSTEPNQFKIRAEFTFENSPKAI